MKKSLIALAALAATGAFAQSSVTLYGVLDMGYGVKEWKNNGTTHSKSAGVQDGAVAGSRFGFRGVEDLGGGLKADFVLEQGLSPTSQSLTNVRTSNSGHQVDALAATGAAGSTEGGRSLTSLNRQTYVGLSGGFGTARIGYQYTNLYELATLSGYTQSSEGLHGGDVAHLAQTSGGTRANGLTYISPSFGGFTARVQYGAGTDLNSFESATAAQLKQERASIMGKYDQGPLSAAIAFTQYKSGTAAAATAASVAASGTPLAPTVVAATAHPGLGVITTTTAKVTQVGASYNLGVAKIGGTYLSGTDGAATESKTTAPQIGVTVPMGALSLMAAMGTAQVKKAGVKEGDYKTWQISANYDLSKRTQVYAYIGETKNDGTASTAIDKKSVTMAGVRHSF